VVIPNLFRNLDAFNEYVKILNTFVLVLLPKLEICTYGIGQSRKFINCILKEIYQFKPIKLLQAKVSSSLHKAFFSKSFGKFGSIEIKWTYRIGRAIRLLLKRSNTAFNDRLVDEDVLNETRPEVEEI